MEPNDEQAVDYELALRLQVEDIPPEFMEEPFLLHEVLHSFFRNDVCHPAQLPRNPETEVCISRTHHAKAEMASCSSAMAAILPHKAEVITVAAVPNLPQKVEVYSGGTSVSGEPFNLFFKGRPATLDDGVGSTVEAVIVAPAGEFVREIASSDRPGISGRLVADYLALRNGLAAALELNILHVQAVGDSKLLEDQMNGALKISSPIVRKLATEVIDLINQLEIFEVLILPRMEHHSTAWDLANEFLKQSDKSQENSRGKMIATEPFTGEETSPVNFCKRMEVIEATTEGYRNASADQEVLQQNKIMVIEANTEGCSSAFSDQEDSSSKKMKMIMMVKPAPQQRCNICLQDKNQKEMLTMNGCTHTFCVTCVIEHTESELKDGRIARCPEIGCRREMDVEQCRNFLSTELFELFTRFLAEASIPEHERLYCPYADCSELFLKISSSPSSSSQTMTWNQATCVTCNRSFCLSCEVPSHAPLSCAEYKELPPEERQEHDLKLFELAALSQWKRCGRCRMMIQRTEGCSHMTCRCGYEFCYNCQAKWRTCYC